MQKLIKSIREYLKLSQSDFAERLGVSPAAVNCWENACIQPTNAEQECLCAFCKAQKVPVYPIILEQIKTVANTITLPENRILLYHGSKSGIVGNIAPQSREMCDFGKGFYMGTDPAQPLTLISDFEQPKFYIVSLAMQELTSIEIKADLDWAMLVAFHRGRMEQCKGTAFYLKYSCMNADKDLVIGSIANDRMFYVLDNFFTGGITDKALISSLSVLKLGKQYVATTEKACAAVRIEKEFSLSVLERRFLQEESEKNRQKGINLANNICKSYRREGKFFDEILDGIK